MLTVETLRSLDNRHFISVMRSEELSPVQVEILRRLEGVLDALESVSPAQRKAFKELDERREALDAELELARKFKSLILEVSEFHSRITDILTTPKRSN